MATNGDNFIAAFNRIEHWLQDQNDEDRNTNFTLNVRLLTKKNPVVARYAEDLYQFARLRNAIVHEETSPNRLIAEPNNWAVTRILQIESAIKNPKRVIPTFAKPVTSFSDDLSVSQLLMMIREKGYSQFPIIDNQQFKGLVTVFGVGVWFAQMAKNPNFLWQKATVMDIIDVDRKSDRFIFIPATMTVEEASNIFQEHLDLFVLLITQNGTPNEPLLGLVRPQDLLSLDD